MTCFIFLIGLLRGYLLFFPAAPLLQDVSFSKQVYDEDNNLLRMTLGNDDQYRIYTPLKDISPLFIKTTLLEEDQYFYFHFGLNPFSIVKAFFQTYILQSRSFGASTISMQLAKLYYHLHTKTVPGKVWQIVKALELECLYSKKEILEAYLNLAPYGGNIEGIGAASLIYFDKSPNQLNLAEALRLSVVPQNPRQRLPSSSNQTALQNAYQRLLMRWIEKHPEDEPLQNLIALPPQLIKKNLPFLAPHFVESILKTNQALNIKSTLNLKLQIEIEKTTQKYLMSHQRKGINNAAILLVDTRDMGIKALIGSGNYFNSEIGGQINGTKAKRSPGSTLKPFIYALALDQGIIHPHTVLEDAPSSFGDYNPENFEQDFLGPIYAHLALSLSRNIPAVYLTKQLKNPSLYDFLVKANVKNLKTEADYGLSLALGSAETTMEEVAALYAMLANLGLMQALHSYESLNEPYRLLSQEASFLALDMLRDTSRPFSIFWKTGTSSNYRDAWAAGIFGPYVLVVWIGDFTNKMNASFIGAISAAPLFFNIIDTVSQNFEKISDIVKVTPEMQLTKIKVCRASGLIPNRCCKETIDTWFIPGKSPITIDHVHREIPINPKTGRRTCHIDQDTQFVTFEFWPSNLLKIFEEAGISPKTPPPFESDSFCVNHPGGCPPKITSPKKNYVYTQRLNKPSQSISFTATADADVEMLYWFLDGEFLGKSKRDEPFLWQLKSGTYLLRVVDQFGQSSSQDFVVKTID